MRFLSFHVHRRLGLWAGATRRMAKSYHYLVPLALSTSGKTGADMGSDESDIVLMAWEVINVAKNQVEAMEQVYVRPNTTLQVGTVFPCGLSSDLIQNSGQLSQVLLQFQSVLAKLHGSFSFVTSDATTLRQCLHPHTTKMAFKLSESFYSYFNLTNEFTKAFPQNPVSSLQDMCGYLGMESLGQIHGLQEAKALGDITQKMLSQGHVFSEPETIQPVQTSFGTSVPTILPESVVRLRGLPYQASQEDISRFLCGLNIASGGVAFGINTVGRRTGEAMVVLENEEMANLALKRDKHYLDQRFIDVFKSSADEFMKCSESDKPAVGNTSNVFVVRMQGLPYRATEGDIVDFFVDAAPVVNGSEGVLIVRYPNGRASGDGFALFGSEKEMEAAMDKKNKQHMLQRYIELFRSSVKEFQLVLSRSGSTDVQKQFSSILGVSEMEVQGSYGIAKGSERNCVKLRGLPWATTPEQVIEFFGELKSEIAERGVHMVVNAQDRPTGECFVQLKSTASAAKAARLDKQYLGSRYIEVFQCSGDEVTHAILDTSGGRAPMAPFNFSGGRSRRPFGGMGGMGGGMGGMGSRGMSGRAGGGGGGGAGGGGGGGRMGGRGVRGEHRVKAMGLPYSCDANELADFFAEYDITRDDVDIIYDEYGRATGIAYVSFGSRGVANQAIQEKDGKYIGRRYVALSLMN